MERIVYFDCFSGASGDMLLGACVDAGFPVDLLERAVAGLGLETVEIDVRRVRRSGIDATKLTVRDRVAVGRQAAHATPAADGTGTPAPAHQHRHLRHILRLIEESTLTPSIKSKASSLFRRIAEAEAAVHGIDPDRVHFHEVGALDSIVDIVGTVLALDWLGATRFVSSPLNTGSGTVRCAHGVMPVPAPATARLVTGAPVYADGPAVELLTPTGALLVTGHASEYGSLPPMTIERIGYGAGDHDFPDRANVVRLVVGIAAGPGKAGIDVHEPRADVEKLRVLECEMDDLNPQVYGALMARLLSAGARDVYYTAVQMKKNRPGTLVTVLAEPLSAEVLLDILFAETTTLGVRMQDVTREALVREHQTVTTPYGLVRIKVGRRRGRVVNVAPEFDDCARLAESSGVPVKEVLAAAAQAWRNV